MITMSESLMDNEKVRRLMIDEIPYSIIGYARYVGSISREEKRRLLDLNQNYPDINSIEDITIDSEYSIEYSEKEIEKAKLCLYKLIDLTRNKIITSDYYKTHVHRGTPNDCIRLFSVYSKELDEIFKILKS